MSLKSEQNSSGNAKKEWHYQAIAFDDIEDIYEGIGQVIDANPSYFLKKDIYNRKLESLKKKLGQKRALENDDSSEGEAADAEDQEEAEVGPEDPVHQNERDSQKGLFARSFGKKSKS